MRDQTLTIHVTRDCLDRGDRTPTACAVALAATHTGISNARAGYATIAGDLRGVPVLAHLPQRARSLIRQIDAGDTATPTTFQATFAPSP